MVKWQFWNTPKPLEASHARGFKEADAKGKTITSYDFNKEVVRIEHSNNMGNYTKWGKDAEARVAMEVLKQLIAGVGFYTEMPEEDQPEDPDAPDHKHKVTIDKYAEEVNLDEQLQHITHQALHKGFCPVEVFESDVSDFDLRLLPSETFYKYVNKKGEIIKYTQERSQNDIITEWKTQEEIDSIVWFQFGEGDYGMSLLEPIGELLDAREQMNIDMPKAIHRWGSPIPIMETSGPKAQLQSACEDRDVDEWIFIGNAKEGDVRWKTMGIDPQARFIPYIELIYYQIAEGLHAPLLLYLKNATEASATVMMESVDRLVIGLQRYIKRRVEKYLFMPQIQDPVPRLMWGQPKTGLEDITLTDVSSIISSPAVANNQVQFILKQFFSGIPEPDWKEEKSIIDAKNPMPLQDPNKPKNPNQVPVEHLLARLNDLQTGLNIIEQNFIAKKIKITEACKLADRTITVFMKRAYPETWEAQREVRFQTFVHNRLLRKKETYKVTVG